MAFHLCGWKDIEHRQMRNKKCKLFRKENEVCRGRQNATLVRQRKERTCRK